VSLFGLVRVSEYLDAHISRNPSVYKYMDIFHLNQPARQRAISGFTMAELYRQTPKQS